jgi:hypothetical protein
MTTIKNKTKTFFLIAHRSNCSTFTAAKVTYWHCAFFIQRKFVDLEDFAG